MDRCWQAGKAADVGNLGALGSLSHGGLGWVPELQGRMRQMFSHVMLGTNNWARAKPSWEAVAGALSLPVLVT